MLKVRRTRVVTALVVAAWITAACAGKPIERPSRQFKLVSDGPLGARRTNAAYIPSEARQHLKAVAAAENIGIVEVPQQTPDAFDEAKGGIEIFKQGAIRIVWHDDRVNKELEFQTIPADDRADIPGFDELFRLCEQAAADPKKARFPTKMVPIEGEPRPGCHEDFGDVGMKLMWASSKGHRFALRDNRPSRSVDYFVKVARAPRVNALES